MASGHHGHYPMTPADLTQDLLGYYIKTGAMPNGWALLETDWRSIVDALSPPLRPFYNYEPNEARWMGVKLVLIPDAAMAP